jgi:hypothetical protein
MEKLLSASGMIEADYRLLCEAQHDDVLIRSANWKRRMLLCLAILLLLSFPVFF